MIKINESWTSDETKLDQIFEDIFFVHLKEEYKDIEII